MTTTAKLGPVSAHVQSRLATILEDRRVVVWYDADGAFKDLVGRLKLPSCVVVDASASRLRARREVETVYRGIDVNGSPHQRARLLIYLPSARPVNEDAQREDPFEAFARCGAAFGDKEAEQLQALAQAAMPERATDIARLFRDARPTLALLDGLPDGARYPRVRQALGSESPMEALALALSRADAGAKLQEVPGSLAELDRLAQTALGLPAGPESWAAWKPRLATCLLVSELASDLPSGLPAALATVVQAPEDNRNSARDVLDRLRETDAGREAYMPLAQSIEQDLRLPAVLGESPALGTRDTFPCQERLRLKQVIKAASGDLASARSVMEAGKLSVWRREPDRGLLWTAAQRCLAFLDMAASLTESILKAPRDLRALVAAYAAQEGLWRLDRAQRLFEQAAAQCTQDDEVEGIVQACRAQYRAMVAPLQDTFQAGVQKEGWPPQGVRRQSQTFDDHVAPHLVARRKTAYFLVDSLRYEMGRDLAEALGELGQVTIEGAASVLPTTTPSGMAALLPGADGALAMVEDGHGNLVPFLGGAPLRDVDDRKAFINGRYGDRYLDITLGDLFSKGVKRWKDALGSVDLLIVRTQDIDALAEGPSLYRARRVMTEVIGELRTAAKRLAGLGFEHLVFASDHGHVLVPEVPPGDVVAHPSGDWPLQKRRCLLGTARASSPGVLVLRARDLGLSVPVPDFAFATGFRTFQAGPGYFHEGLSLQECIVPVIALHAGPAALSTGGEQVVLKYRGDRFTSSVIGLKVTLTAATFSQELSVKLEAYDGTGPKAGVVGRAAESDARDSTTGEVRLKAGEETQVPLMIEADYRGDMVEVRAIDPRTGAVLDRLKLKNGRLD